MIQRLVVVLSENAISDLEAIGTYILENSGSENIANSFVDRIKERCQSIGNAPRGAAPAMTSYRDCERFRSSILPSSPISLTAISFGSSTFSMAVATTRR